MSIYQDSNDSFKNVVNSRSNDSFILQNVSQYRHGHLEDWKNLHTEKYFRNIIKSTRGQIVFTIFRLLWNQTDIRLVPTHSEYGKYYLILC